MDTQTIQKIRAISHQIIAEEFPEEEEYFDFLFDLTIQEIEQLEPGKEAEFVEQMRAAHPEGVLGFTPYVIIFTLEVLTEPVNNEMNQEIIKKRIFRIIEDKNQKKF